MTFVDHAPNATPSDSQSLVAELMEETQANLLVLAAFAPYKSMDNFNSYQDYIDYCGSLRYLCGPVIRQRIHSSGLVDMERGFALNARELEAEGLEGWNVNILRVGDDISPEKGVSASRYIMQVMFCEGEEQDLKKVITVAGDSNTTDEPQLTYWDKDGLIPDEVVIESSETESSYAFRVVRAVSEQLCREADALIALSFEQAIQ